MVIEPIASAAEEGEHKAPPLTARARAPARARWVSCCIETDRQAVVYLGQMAFSGAIIALCAMMLVRADGDCSVSSPYISLLSFLAGKILASVVASSD